MSRDPLIKSQFASYFIQDRIKAGGMATVYKAFDHERQTVIALKILHDSLIDHEDIVRRFEQEAKIGQQLKHPHIVPFYDAGQYGGKLYISMQYISGGSLAEAIVRKPQVTLSYTAKILFEIASALDFAHKRKIVHRDLKLGNILMNSDGHAMLTDFGIARWLGESNLTLTGQQMPGTVKYMSPEQAIGRTDLDYRSDLYSFAVIAYLMTVGCYPFTGVSEIVIINQHLHMDVPKPSLVHNALPPALDDVILQSLSKNPENRFLSAGEFSKAFNEAIVGYEDVEVFINMRADNPGAKPLTSIRMPDSIPGVSQTTDQSASDPHNTIVFPKNAEESSLGTPFFPTIEPETTEKKRNQWLVLVLMIAIASAVLIFALINNEASRLSDEEMTATENALIALLASETPTPSDTPTPEATNEPIIVSTDSETQNTDIPPTETETDAPPTATNTLANTATATHTPTQTASPTATATTTDTPTATPTFTPSLTPTATATPTPLFYTLDAVVETLLALPSQSRFDCALFNETYEFLNEEIRTGNPQFIDAEVLLDEEDDPLREIYENECGENSNAEQHSIPFDLFFEMQDALRLFTDV